MIVIIFFTAFALNFIWEIGHSTLYTGYTKVIPHWLLLLLAAIADAVLTAIILWFSAKFQKRGLAVFFSGVVASVLIEAVALRFGFWQYTASMPKIAGLGLSPILQMAILPLLILFVIGKIKNHDTR